MTNAKKLELQLRRKFGLIARIDGECITNKLPEEVAALTVKQLEKLLSKDGELVNISFLNVNVERKNALIHKLSEKCCSAEWIRNQDRFLRSLLEKQITNKIDQNLGTQPHGQLMAQTLLDELEDLEFGEYRGPIEFFENSFKALEPKSNSNEFLAILARAIFELVMQRSESLAKKLDINGAAAASLH